MHTEAVEDYLKTIYELQKQQGKVNTNTLAEKMAVSPPSATVMIKKLAELGLAEYQPYYGVLLSEAGRRAALKVIRHHRLLECYLVEKLGLSWDQAHAQAELWEHSLLEQVAKQIDTALDYPTHDPHGSPIPTAEGEIAQYEYDTLASLEADRSAIIAEVSDHDPALLRYLGQLGLYPGVRVDVVAKSAYDNLLTLQVGERSCVLGGEVTQYIQVIECEF